jgi:hypothetical protein
MGDPSTAGPVAGDLASKRHPTGWRPGCNETRTNLSWCRIETRRLTHVVSLSGNADNTCFRFCCSHRDIAASSNSVMTPRPASRWNCQPHETNHPVAPSSVYRCRQLSLATSSSDLLLCITIVSVSAALRGHALVHRASPTRGGLTFSRPCSCNVTSAVARFAPRFEHRCSPSRSNTRPQSCATTSCPWASQSVKSPTPRPQAAETQRRRSPLSQMASVPPRATRTHRPTPRGAGTRTNPQTRGPARLLR